MQAVIQLSIPCWILATRDLKWVMAYVNSQFLAGYLAKYIKLLDRLDNSQFLAGYLKQNWGVYICG